MQLYQGQNQSFLQRYAVQLKEWAIIIIMLAVLASYKTIPLIRKSIDLPLDFAVAGITLGYQNLSTFVFRVTGLNMGLVVLPPDPEFVFQVRLASYVNAKRAGPLLDIAIDPQETKDHREQALRSLLKFDLVSDWIQPFLNELGKGGLIGLYDEDTPVLDELMARVRAEGGIRQILVRDFADSVLSFMMQHPKSILRQHALKWVNDLLAEDAIYLIADRIKREDDPSTQKSIEYALWNVRAMSDRSEAVQLLYQAYYSPRWPTVRMPLAYVLTRCGYFKAKEQLRHGLTSAEPISQDKLSLIRVAIDGRQFPRAVSLTDRFDNELKQKRKAREHQMRQAVAYQLQIRREEELKHERIELAQATEMEKTETIDRMAQVQAEEEERRRVELERQQAEDARQKREQLARQQAAEAALREKERLARLEKARLQEELAARKKFEEEQRQTRLLAQANEEEVKRAQALAIKKEEEAKRQTQLAAQEKVEAARLKAEAEARRKKSEAEQARKLAIQKEKTAQEELRLAREREAAEIKKIEDKKRAAEEAARVAQAKAEAAAKLVAATTPVVTLPGSSQAKPLREDGGRKTLDKPDDKVPDQKTVVAQVPLSRQKTDLTHQTVFPDVDMEAVNKNLKTADRTAPKTTTMIDQLHPVPDSGAKNPKLKNFSAVDGKISDQAQEKDIVVASLPTDYEIEQELKRRRSQAAPKKRGQMMAVDLIFQVKNQEVPLYVDPGFTKLTGAVLPIGTKGRVTFKVMVGEDEWYQVKAKKDSGWANASMLLTYDVPSVSEVIPVAQKTERQMETTTQETTYFEPTYAGVPYFNDPEDAAQAGHLEEGVAYQATKSRRYAGERWFLLQVNSNARGWSKGVDLQLASAILPPPEDEPQIASPNDKFVMAIEEGVTVYSRPSIAGKRIKVIKPGDAYKIMDVDEGSGNEWYKIQITGSRSGWVQSMFVKIKGGKTKKSSVN